MVSDCNREVASSTPGHVLSG